MTSRFTECAQRIGTLVENPTVEASTKIALRAIEIANLLALNNSAQVPDKLQALLDSLAAQPDDFKVILDIQWHQTLYRSLCPTGPLSHLARQLFTALEAETARQCSRACRQHAQACSSNSNFGFPVDSRLLMEADFA